MRIFESMEVAGSALTAHRLWMDTISSNLANINTTRTLAGGPYKRRVPVFAEMLDKTIGGYRDIGGVRVTEITEDKPGLPAGTSGRQCRWVRGLSERQPGAGNDRYACGEPCLRSEPFCCHQRPRYVEQRLGGPARLSS